MFSTMSAFHLSLVQYRHKFFFPFCLTFSNKINTLNNDKIKSYFAYIQDMYGIKKKAPLLNFYILKERPLPRFNIKIRYGSLSNVIVLL